MAFSTVEILADFVEVAHRARPHLPTTLEELLDRRLRYRRAIVLAGYHKLHADPAWRERRKAKMQKRRDDRKALGVCSECGGKRVPGLSLCHRHLEKKVSRERARGPR